MSQESRLVITVDTRSAEQRVRDLGRALAELDRHGLGAQAGVEGINRVVTDTTRSANDAAAAMGRMFKAAIAGLSVMKVVDTADEWGQLASRMKMATQSAEEYEQAQSRMLQSANNTYRSINETRESFIQLSPVLRQMGMSLGESMDAIDAFSGLLVVNAASGDRAQAAMRALSISLQKNKIDADSWITIYSTLDSVVGEIAAHTRQLGGDAVKTEEQIRKLGAEGKLSVDLFAGALAGRLGEINRQVAAMPTTVRDAVQKVGNEFTEYLGTANEARGVTAGLADGIAFVGENLAGILNTAVVAGGVAMAAYTSRTIGATAATVADAMAKRAAAFEQVALTQQELAAAQVQNAQTAATLAQTRAAQHLGATRAQLTAATTAQEASERRLAAAQAASSAAQAGAMTVGRGVLGLFGGPLGLVATLGLTAAGFIAIEGAAARSKLSMEILGGTVDEAVRKFTALAESQRRAAIAMAQANYAEAIKGFDDSLRTIERGSLADGTAAVARWRSASTQALQEVADAAKTGTISYEEMDERIVQLIDSYASANGRSKEWVAQQIEIASKVATAGRAAGDAKTLMDELTAAHDRVAASAAGAAGGVAGLNGALIKTDEAAMKYLENLEDRALIAGLTTQRQQLEALVEAGKHVYAPEDLERARKAADRIDAATKATRSLKTETTDAARAAKQLAEWLAEQKISTASTDAMTAAYFKGGSAISELTRLQKIEEQVLKSGEKARASVTAAITAQGRAMDRLDVAKTLDELRRQNAAATAYIGVLKAQSIGLEEGRAALESYNAEQALAALLLGKSADEVADLTEKYRLLWAEHAGIERQTEAQRDLNQLVDSTRTKQERYNAELARLQGLKGYAGTTQQVEALSRAMKQLERENSVWFEFTEKALERIDGAFADMWKSFIEGSGSAFDVVKGGFKQFLAEMAHAAVTRPIMISVGNSIMGTSNPGGWGDVWGGSGKSTVGQGVGIVNAVQTAWGALSGGLTTTLATGVAKIGGAIGSQALTSFASGLGGAMGPAAPGMAGFMSAGGMVGAALPWVAGAAAVYGLISSFANDPETRVGAQYGLARDGQLYNPRRGTTVDSADGVQFLEGPSGGGASAAVQQAIQGTVDGINGLFRTIGADISLAAFWAGYEGSEKNRGGVGAGGMLSSGASFGEVGTGDNYRGTLFDPNRPGSLTADEALSLLPAQLAQASLQAWQSAAEQMPDALARMLRGVDLASLGDDALVALRDQFIGVVAQAEMLRLALGELPIIPATARTFDFALALAEAAGSADNAANMLAGFYQNYVREADRTAHLTESLTSRFAALGYALPTSRDEMFALVQANLALGEAGAKTAAELLSMEAQLSSILPAFDAVADAVEAVVNPLDALNTAMDSQLETVRRLTAESVRLDGVLAAGSSTLDRIATALGRTGQYGPAREAQLWAQLTSASYEQQLDLAGQLTDLVLDRIEAEQAAAQAQIEALTRQRDVARGLGTYLDSLRTGDLSPLTLGQRTAEAERQLADAVARASGGDEQALGQVQQLTDAALRLWREYGASGADYQQAYHRITGMVGDLAGQQLSEAERQIALHEQSIVISDASRAQLEQLHGVAERAYAAIDAQYQATLLGSRNELAVLTAMASDTDRLHEVAGLLQGMPAGIAAALQPVLSGALSNIVSGWYAGAGYGQGDQTGRDYWQGQLGQRPQADVQKDFLTSLVTEWYQDGLGHGPDSQGLAYWVDQAQKLGSEQARRDFLWSAGIHGSHRDGLWSVPFDGYNAQLHRGETVLPEPEARRYRALESMPDWSQYGRQDNAEMVAELRALRQEVAQLRAEQARQAAQQAAATMAAAQESATVIVHGVGGSIEREGRRTELASRKGRQ